MTAVQCERMQAALRGLYAQNEYYAARWREGRPADFETAYALVRGYVCSRFLLDADENGDDDLLALADASLRRIMMLRREGISVEGPARSCAGASSVITKKILLFKAMQEDFSLRVPPEDFARITTVTKLTQHLLEHKASLQVDAAREEICDMPTGFDPLRVRPDFPALARRVHGRVLVYLDNAATMQMPQVVAQTLAQAEMMRGNAHRGAHTIAQESGALYERSRSVCAAFLGAQDEQIVFTAGATDGINRVARALEFMRGGVVVTALEHHSNFVPWQQACRRLGRPFRMCPVDANGALDMRALKALLTPDIAVLAVTMNSNVLGLSTPLEEICALAHERGVRVLVDAAQGACHRRIDVEALGCDWLVCSGHKLGGPAGIGVLYCREALPPVVFGGGMVETVTAEHTSFAAAPLGNEAGTPNVAGAAALAAAIEYRAALPAGWQEHERALLALAEKRLGQIAGVRLLGSGVREGCLSFVVDGMSSLDVALLLDGEGIALRSGNFCAQPLMAVLGIESALRLSCAFYNTADEIECFAAALRHIVSAGTRSGF